MNAKEFRISRLLNSKSGKSVVIPIDHGLVMGNVEGLTDPLKILKDLVKLGIDGTLLSPGLAKVTLDLFSRRDAPSRVLTADLPLTSNVPGGTGEVMGHEIISTVEFALKYGFDAVKILLPWGEESGVQMESLRVVAKLANECDRWEIPLMVEPVLWGNAIPKERKNSPELIGHGARMALEMGADILKIPYTGDEKEFEDLVKSVGVPVFILGGPKMEGIEGILRIAHESTQAGAKGIVFGRNVWQNPKMGELVRALKKVVHEGKGVKEVLKTI